MSVAASSPDLPAEPFGQTGVRQYVGRIMAWLCLTIGLCAAAMSHRSGRFTDGVSWSGRGQKLAVISVDGQLFVAAGSRQAAGGDGQGWTLSPELGARRALGGSGWQTGVGDLLGLEVTPGPPPLLSWRGGPGYDSGFGLRAQWGSLAALFLIWPLVYGVRKIVRAIRPRADYRPMRFSVLDLLVSAVVVASLSVGTLAVRRTAQENSVIVACAGRLGRIGQSLALYEGVYDGRFPRTRHDPALPLTAYTAPDGPEPQPNDTTAAMFLLARTIELPPSAFTCPAAVRHGLAEEDTFDRRTAKQRHNFRARLNSNYALANMYPDAAAVAAGYSLDGYTGRLPDNFVIAADTGPGPLDASQATPQMSRGQIRIGNSPNHERDGQNVLTADGVVQFFSAATVGVGYDNIYTGQSATPQPATATDSVLVPAWQEGPALLPRLVVGRRWTLLFAVVLTFAALFWVVRSGLKGRGPVVDPGTR